MLDGAQPRYVSILIVGAGQRGSTYSQYALENPNLCKVIAVAEPRQGARNKLVKSHHISADMVFTDWRQLCDKDKLADAVVIATQDTMHKDPAIFFASKGYHILLEKPMAVTEADCKEIVSAVKKAGVIMAIGHVMRYTAYSRRIKAIVESGTLGEIVSIQHLEPVGWFHQAHSYVRGNWRRTDESSPMLLAKSCHDLDWINWIMNSRCLKISSFGTLKHFRTENKPKGAADRCLDCPVEKECAYSAKQIYLKRIENGHKKWPVSVLIDGEPTVENVTEALKTGPYGRCVYECDNDVVDNQVVNMLFEGGQTATFTMVAFTKDVCIRKTRIFGTRGELEGDGHIIRTFEFSKLQSQTIDPTAEERQLSGGPFRTLMSGHGYGDWYLMRDFVDAVSANDPSKLSSTPEQTLESHLMVFRAEKARLENIVADLEW